MSRNTKAKEEILAFLLDNPDQKFYLTQIAHTTGIADSTVQQILEEQVKKRFLIKEKVGNLSYYSLNSDNPLVKQAKIERTLQEMAHLIEKLKDVSEKVILFGSSAFGKDTGESDIDLFVLSNNEREVREIIFKAKKKRRITAVVKNYPGWVALEKENKYLYNEINKGIILWEKKYE